MNTKIKNLITIALLFLAVSAFSQEKKEMKTMPFHFSFITPIGTNGMESWNTINNISLNMFGGVSGGLDGFEAAGYFNVLLGDMKGAQFAGFANADLGKSQGAQFAGFVNYNKDSLVGAQFAGFANVITNDSKAIQAAGFTNAIIGSVDGVQLSGFANAATKDSKVVQLSGFANMVKGKVTGFQGSGFANYSQGNTIGQVSGYANANIGDLKGVQLAGFANVNTGRLEGFQASGFINVANKLKGVQMGVFNYVDSLESGLAIGFISVVRNGYRAIEVSTNESFYANATFKTGTRQFYNILSLAGTERDNSLIWAFGYGIGTTLTITDKTDLNIEGMLYHVNEDEWHTDRINELIKIQAVTTWQFSEIAALYGGPSWNIMVTDTDHNNEAFESVLAPYNVFEKSYNNGNKVTMYPGLTVGVRF